MRDDIDPDRIGTRTVDNRLYRENIGTGLPYLNPVGPIDYDRFEELPPPVFGLLTMADLVWLKRVQPLFAEQYGRIAA